MKWMDVKRLAAAAMAAAMTVSLAACGTPGEPAMSSLRSCFSPRRWQRKRSDIDGKKTLHPRDGGRAGDQREYAGFHPRGSPCG